MEKVPLVFLVGDSCTDIFTHVRMTNRANPEDPSHNIYAIEKTEIKEGMASNVYACLIGLGLDVIAATNKPQEISKTRIIDATTGCTITRLDSTEPVQPADIDFEEIDKILSDEGMKFDALVISDYDKGYVTSDFIKELATRFKDVPMFLDTKKKNLQDFSEYIIKINLDEARKAESLPKHTIITRAEHGAMQGGVEYPGVRIPVRTKVDPCGAGDAFLAGLVYGVLVNKSVGIAEGIANSAVSVQHPGTYAPNKEEFLETFYKYTGDQLGGTW